MIRFAVGAAFLAVSFFGSEIRAQQKVYVEQEFASGNLSDVWDELDNIFYRMTMNNGKSYGGWIYDPQGSFFGEAITSKVTGFRSFRTKPFSIEEEGDLYLYFNSVYRTNQQSEVRNMGVRLGNEKSGWDTLYVVRKEGEVFPKNSPGKYEEKKMKLDDKFKGRDSVVFEFFIYNDKNATDGCLFGIGDILLASFDTAANVTLAVTSQPYFYQEESRLDLNISNTSTEDVDSVKIGMSMDGGAVDTASCTFATALGMLDQKSVQLDLDLSGLEKGNHVLKMWVSEINGLRNEVGEGDTAVFSFLFTDPSNLSPFRPIVEVMTASWCGYCPAMNETIDPIAEAFLEKGKISIVKFQQNGDRYSLPEGNTRYSMYGATGVPFPVYNGEEVMSQWGGTYGAIADAFEKKLANDTALVSPFIIDFKDVMVNGGNGQLEFSLDVTSVANTNGNVGIVVVEGKTTGNRGSNGEKEFHWVAMAMPTGARGKATEFEAGKPVEFKYSVDMSRTHAEEYTDLQIVCFIQDMNTFEMLQSNQYILTAENVGVEADGELSGISLYPNPARSHFNLAGAENARVEFFDLMGRKVYGLEGVTGDRVISTDLFKAGTYVVRISQDGRTSVRKIAVVK